MMEIASMQKVQRDPCRALGRKDRVIVSWNRIPEHCRPFARLGPGFAGQVAGFGSWPVVGPYGVG